MPYTPFHVPPNALVGFPLRRQLDLPMLLLANLAMDVEPLVVTLFDLGPPPHGPVHTFLGAVLVGATAGALFWRSKGLWERLLRGEYPLTLRTGVLSGVIGSVIHVALDAVMYAHIRPFYPLEANPLHWPGSGDALHLATALLLLPVAALFWRHRYWRTVSQKLSSGLLVLAAVGMAVSVAVGAV